MIEGCDWLSQQHFGKRLADSGLDILDPCMGTGTFIVDLLDYWRGDHHALSYKFANEVHANEISILPYYIASLNIEQTYYEITEQWREFSGACFVNTLDNWGFKQTHSGANMDIFGSLTDENHARIEAQNARNIPIIIGNPPYNANQQNENDNNKNDAAPTADKRIKDTYLAESTAQKTKLYDPYIRFFRWASDRLGEQGILAFITNRSYLDSRQADGFRKTVAKEFQAIWIIDLMSDVRKNPKISGTKHNIFGIQAGVAIVFLVRTASPLRTGSPALDSEIHYLSLDDFLLATEKRAWLKNHSLRRLAKAGQFRQITPNKQGTWLNQAQEYDDWNSWLPIASKEAKLGKTNEVIFKLHSLGVVTARDEWICGHSEAEVSEKTRTLIEMYQAEQKRWKKSDHTMNIEDFVNRSIKWTTELTAHLVKGTQLKYRRNFIVPSMYRPFVENFLYYDKVVVHRTYQQTHIFPIGAKRSASSACNVGEACTPANLAIGISGNPNAKPFQTLVVASLPCYDLLEKTQFLPLWIYDKDGSRHENITDHALKLFQAHYYASQKSFLGRYKYILCNPKTFLGRYKNILYKTKSISDDTKTFYTNPKSISDSTKPSNTSSASFSESTKPSNTISAGISDSKAPSNTISASISDSKAPSNTISACISDSKAPSNTSSASISDSTAPSNTISACISDSTAPFNTSSADISDSTKPSDTSSVGISDSTALSNTISASNSDSTKPSDTSSASISDNTEALTASSECISDGIKTSDTNTESISVVPMCGENQNLRGFKNLAGLNTDLNKTDIFNYVYAVLHDPRYRQKFALNLKAEFPRIPFHPNFSAWAAIGEKLIKLHAHFEQVEPWEFDRRDAINRVSTKCRLKADKINHCIEIDSDTTLSNIPPEAWQYQLGNRSALEWVLDQYKEKTPKDPTIREKFNTYRFADHKEEVIELLAKVCRVSVDTVALVAEIEKLPWD
jgi:predicted helicase